MPFHVRDEETDRLVRALARRKGIGLTEAVKLAVRHELAGGQDQPPLRERLRAIAKEIAALPDTGLQADKAFYDELSGT
jgi:antitoxin VapB